MADNNTTQRAYTLRLQGDREPLWRSHCVFNRGVRMFGSLLLNMRGALPPSLADDENLLPCPGKDSSAKVKRSESDHENALEPSKASRCTELRRTLALSWLSPETPVGLVPAGAIVPATDVVSRFEQILRAKGADDTNEWHRDCDGTLQAAIRDDAVWVDRWQCYNDMPDDLRPPVADARAHLFDMMGKAAYFASEAAGDAEAKDFGPAAGNWISTYWGEGTKSDRASIAERLQAIAGIDATGKIGSEAIDMMLAAVGGDTTTGFVGLCKAIGWRKGRHSKGRLAIERVAALPVVTAEEQKRFVEKVKDEADEKQADGPVVVPQWAKVLKASLLETVGIPFRPAGGSSCHFELATMLATALRRVSQIHTKSKQAECERLERAADMTRRGSLPAKAAQWLDAYVAARSEASGATDGYRLRTRAIGKWSEVVKAWGGCKTAEARIEAVWSLQAEWEDKGGDVGLYEALAADDAVCTWQQNDKPAPTILQDYVRATVAEHDAARLKVPAYRHPDPLRSPVFAPFGDSQWDIVYLAQAEADGRAKLLSKAKGRQSAKVAAKTTAALAAEPDLQGVQLKLWNGDRMVQTSYRWQSRRLFSDLALGSVKNLDGQPVARASRIGRSRAGAGSVLLDGIVGSTKWNGRLQAPRRQLEDIARAVEALSLPADDESTWPDAIKKRLNHVGWFLGHSAKLRPSGPWLDYVAKGLPDGWSWRQKRAFLLIEDNKKRKGRARLALARLPGLRVVSVDLGMRVSAAAAVWQVISQRELDAAKRQADKITAGDLFCFLKSGERTTVYRRTSDTTWARLDRQFLIKLSGEDKAARPATTDEWQSVQSLHRWVGLPESVQRQAMPPVDGLQQEAVRLCRQGLRGLSDVARIAYLLGATERPGMGGRMQPLEDGEQVEATLDALIIWRLLIARDESDGEMRDLWVRHVGDLPESEGRITKKRRDAIRVELRLAAVRLRGGDPSLVDAITSVWNYRSAEWARHLRWLRDWIVPRAGRSEAHLARNVGGLSLDRIGTIKGVYQCAKAYATRPEPANLRAGIERIERAAAAKVRREFGRRILEKMERLREDRARQIASRIIEAAYGLGSESNTRHGRQARPSDDPRFAPCHAVVIERLEGYRPDDKRMRRENRGLMSWAAGAIRKHLTEGCELYGLRLEEVSPAYTSRQDSRTGAPGLRCNDVPMAELTREGGWLAKQIAAAERAANDGKASARQHLLAEMAGAARRGEITSPNVRLIAQGGQIFVSADPASPAASGCHADMNAAANIGLVALMDPDWSASWWRVPCSGSSGEADAGSVTGSAAMAGAGKLLDGGAKQNVVNAWSAPAVAAIRDRKWMSRQEYWADVEAKVAEALRVRYGLVASPPTGS